ncbi:hypothetical protein ABZ863_01915 [Saccharomonospora sp. NPDC046836]|uniref:hypothetical protein n=1 Tax=Saccharomonospora sp. NPDC046836 TaxID=3156921 RepID=UPI0033F74254
MAPTVLRCTPQDAELLDRTGIIGASVAPQHGGTGQGTEPTPGTGVNRSGMASLVAAVLMLVVAFGAVVDVQRPGGPSMPLAGGAAGEEPVVAAESPVSAEMPGEEPPPKREDLPEQREERQAPAPAAVAAESTPVVEPAEPPRTVAQAKASVPEVDPQPAPVRSSEQQVAKATPEARADGPPAPTTRFTVPPSVRELLDPMLQYYEQNLPNLQAHQWRGRSGDHGHFSWRYGDRSHFGDR